MCGIVGAIAKRPIAKLLLDGLKRLEYRGYDSAGLAVLNAKHKLERLRVLGKVKELEQALNAHPLTSHLGIAHTRWATHGVPSEQNAHPFISNDEFALVHNGIVENHAELRVKLNHAGYQFVSETDTETVVHLIHYYFQQNKDLLTAVRQAIDELRGAYAFAILSTHFPHGMIAVRQGAPLVIGKGKGENFLASDPLALLTETQQFIYLEDYDIAEISLDQVRIFDKKNQLIERETHTLTIAHDAVERGQYRHYMKKEIMEQPDAISSGLEGRIIHDRVLEGIFGATSEDVLQKIEHVQFVACGTSYHAAMVARYWIEALAHIPCSVEVASEFRYRELAPAKNSLFVVLSQSGETADTMAALRLAKQKNYLSTLAICNVPGSSMVREANFSFLIRAGIEIAVASTKGFVSQLIALLLLALRLRRHKNGGTIEEELVQQLQHLPAAVEQVLQQDDEILAWAKLLTDKQHVLFLGRGLLYPVALEGALKMKEISYLHAEGYPAGELKHGPLALVDDNMPVIASVPNDHLLEKNLSNLREVCARGGRLFILSDQPNLFNDNAFSKAHLITMPSVHPTLLPILYTVPLQLLAYHVAVLKGTDVDQPRNLAKSVTVE